MRDFNGILISVRALIDPGSELSFITEKLIRLLDLQKKSSSIPLVGIGGNFSGRTKGVVKLNLYSIYDVSAIYSLQAFVLRRLTFTMPSIEVSRDSWCHLEGISLADPDFNKPGPIEIIIGADSYCQIIMPDLKRGGLESPIAQKTLFGWVVSGPATVDSAASEVQGYHCLVDCDHQDLLTRFWHQEESEVLGSRQLSGDDAECEEHFKNTFTRNDSGRYVVRLPIKSSVSMLGESYMFAVSQLQLRHKLIADQSYCRLYTDFLKKYVDRGHMMPIQDSEINRHPHFYLLHHGDLTIGFNFTKIRVVFNGSRSTTSGVSLNDILYSGEKLQRNISQVLLWFRIHRYVFSTDIEKMFRQIVVHPDDRDLQRVVWYDSFGNLSSFKLSTITYGMSCAPYLALRVLKQLVEDEGSRFPKAISSLTQGRYVDDIFGGAETIAEAREIIVQLIQLCNTGGFPLQKWSSNCKELLFNLPLYSQDSYIPIPIDSSKIKVLGIHWSPHEDVFKFTTMPRQNYHITKRTILSEIAQLYDPLGFIAPVIIRAKLIIQLWVARVAWDDPITTELLEPWNDFRYQLNELTRLKLSRWLNISSTVVSIEMHGFSDASQVAMAAVIYLRVELLDNNVKINLICAKTKVASLKRITTPRLELNAAVLLAHLVLNTQDALNLRNCRTFLWTDSTVTLCRIGANPVRWKDYV